MIELLSTETKPVYIGYNKLAADVAEATTDALTGADYIALQATIKYLWFMVILLAVVALLALVVAVIAKGRADRLDRQLNGTRRGFESLIDDFEDEYDNDEYLRTGCTSAILSVFLQQHEGRPWLDVLLCAEEDSPHRSVLCAGRIPRYVGWRVRRAGFLF